jgi:hypothetical protein
LPIQRSASVISQVERIPGGPSVGSRRGTVTKPASRRAIENDSP